MALRSARHLAQRVSLLRQPTSTAVSDRCWGSATQLSSAGAQWQGSSATLVTLGSCGLHGSAAPRAGGDKEGVDSANQELEEFFGVRPAGGPRFGSIADSPADGTAGGGRGRGGGPAADLSQRQTPGVHAAQGAQSEELRVRASEPKLAESQSLAHPKPTASGRLTHIDKDGRAAMVDVGKKLDTQRKAVATAKVLLGAEVFTLVASNSIKKGDVLTVAELAGLMGAKHTSFLIPLCHNISLDFVDVKLNLLDEEKAVSIRAEARTVGPTGVEMEALTAATTAALTIYDMCKAVSRRLVIAEVVLESKHGGKSGTYIRSEHGAAP